ncbi:MAG: Leucine rich repeat protein [Parcubacteria group bacterium GW2011_GWA2_46_9]|nr:MAG: Leucine rich repeat protein [Parcubacteria group bacterium GW2011_GWA2_46_9]
MKNLVNVHSGFGIDVGREALKRAEQLGRTATDLRERAESDVSDGQVRLDLSNKGLDSLPAYVLDMTYLEELNLSSNGLTGALPAEIRKLRNLRKLDVSRNSMTGIPAEISQLSNLEVLDYSYNQITGMPYELANLKKLKTFNLTGNKFSEQDLTVIIKDLPNLQVVY